MCQGMNNDVLLLIIWRMINTSVVFDHRGRTQKGKEGPLEVRVTVNRKPYYVNTGIRVRKDEWKYGAVVNRVDSAELNDRLSMIVRKVESEINMCLREELPIDVAEIRRKVNDVKEEMDTEPFLDWIDEQREKMPREDGTLKHYATLMKRLREFGRMRKWRDVTTENIVEFDSWLHRLPKVQTKAQILAKAPVEYLSDSGVYNYHKCLKALLYLAKTVKKIKENPYEDLKGRFKKGERESTEYLTDEEIDAIRSLELEVGSHLCMIRDLFVIQLFTGMAYADLMAFDICDYRLVGGKWLHNDERVKTGVAYVAHLLPPVVEVLERYGMQVPHISNQKYNKGLKRVAELAGVRTSLHTHLGRHSFATYMLNHDVKLHNLQRMMGHKDIKMTMKYAKALAKNVHEDFDKIAEGLK